MSLFRGHPQNGWVSFCFPFQPREVPRCPSFFELEGLSKSLGQTDRSDAHTLDRRSDPRDSPRGGFVYLNTPEMAAELDMR